jgi:hypothetical protein
MAADETPSLKGDPMATTTYPQGAPRGAPRGAGASGLTILLISACALAVSLGMALYAPAADLQAIGWSGLVLFSCLALFGLTRLRRRPHESLAAVYDAETGPLSEEEITDRLPVWEAIAELWLDVEMRDSEIKYVAQRLAQSKYSMAELEGIYLYEVAPVVHLNLRGKEGEQASFPIEWLRDEILKHLAKGGYHGNTADQEAYLTEYVIAYWDKAKLYIQDYWDAGV